MDPNETLEDLRAEVAIYNKYGSMGVDGGHVCELVQALDEWISKGGLPPAAWEKRR